MAEEIVTLPLAPEAHRPDRSLLGLGARVPRRLGQPKPVSRVWDEISSDAAPWVPYESFVLQPCLWR